MQSKSSKEVYLKAEKTLGDVSEYLDVYQWTIIGQKTGILSNNFTYCRIKYRWWNDYHYQKLHCVLTNNAASRPPIMHETPE